MTIVGERTDDEILEDSSGDLEESEPKRQRRPIDWLVVGAVLTTLGLSLVLFLVYVFAFTNFQEARAQRQLLNAFTTSQGVVPLSGKLPADGLPTAVLTIPTLNLSKVAVQGTSSKETAQGPGVMSQAARPGTIGNAVIIGRRSTSGAPFAKLNTLRSGDKIKIASGLGVFHYVVVHSGVVTPGQKDPASPVNRPLLTLMTAENPGGNSSKYYVVARLVGGPGAAPKPTTKPTASALGSTGDASAVVPSIILGILYLLCIAGTIVAYKRNRANFWTVYIISTPIVLALALFWFEHLYLLLPATF